MHSELEATVEEAAPVTKEDIAKIQAALRAKAAAFARKLAPVYAQLGWTWTSSWVGVEYRDQVHYVPVEIQIANTLFRLINELPSTPTCYISTGGLAVYGEKNSDGSLSAVLRFELDEDCTVHY